MPLPYALLLIALGLALLLWGRGLLSAWLPVFYGLLGFELGYLLGVRLFGHGSAPIIAGVLLAIGIACATYVLEPYRRTIIGYLGGSIAALAMLGLERASGGVLVAVVAVCGGVAGALLATRYFDYFVIATTAYGGAALTALGTQGLLPLLGAPGVGGSVLPFLLTAALTAIGVVYQMRQRESWAANSLVGPGPARHEDDLRGGAR